MSINCIDCWITKRLTRLKDYLCCALDESVLVPCKEHKLHCKLSLPLSLDSHLQVYDLITEQQSDCVFQYCVGMCQNIGNHQTLHMPLTRFDLHRLRPTTVAVSYWH